MASVEQVLYEPIRRQVRGELLLELLSEEIPARMQRRAIEDLTGLLRDKLKAAEIPAEAWRGYVTPRRLAVIGDGIPAQQPDRTEERRGPRVGAPQRAIEGFLRSAGLATVEQCERRDTGRGEFYFAVAKHAGQAAAAVLPELIRAAMAELPWPKSMRYPAATLRWVRPLTSAICLFDGEVLPLALDRVPVGRVTRGHRFLSEGEIGVADAADYLARLEAAYVVLDQNRRREMIRSGLDEAAAAARVSVKEDAGLLEEVTGLVEYPVVLMGAIDPDLVRPVAEGGLPPEVLATAMRTHQKYFSCLDADGSPAPRFLFVANNRAPEGGGAIVSGNERVLRARLADARFFWDQDRKLRLDDRVETLKQRVYHEKLGSVYDKAERVEKLAIFLADAIRWPQDTDQSRLLMPGLVPGIHGSFAREPRALSSARADPASGGGDGRVQPGHGERDQCKALAQRAARLAKADLSTGMVAEFPELQGVMGRYYAVHDGEDPRVADAIAEHYKPLGPNDTCPTAPVSILVALADKIDTLAAFFSIGERPTGSGDPFALRRAAQGVIRLVLEKNRPLRLSLLPVFNRAQQGIRPDNDMSLDLLAFLIERLKVRLRDQGYRYDVIAAALARAGEREDDLARLQERVAALNGFIFSEAGAGLLIAFRRAANIVSIEERRDGRRYDGDVLTAELRESEEKELAEQLDIISEYVKRELARDVFQTALIRLMQLRAPVDRFFDKVTVNTDDRELRANRLRLLSHIRDTMNQVADFSQIEGDPAKLAA
ncbi:MAG: glycine--tRNA ligase subunit beta [Alphaproteobacteria bacterium]|nr:glycine--tRNA ligase subunit beta [Alphaproteobacteria bacterium]